MPTLVGMKPLYALFALLLLSATAPDTKVLICISTGASKYHSHYCQGLKKCTHQVKEVSISDARNRGYSACGYCY